MLPSAPMADLCHIGYVVPNMKRALEQFHAWGCETIIRDELDPIQGATCALLGMPGGIPIELVAPDSAAPDHPLSSRLKRGGGLDHVCIFVDDVERELESWRERRAVIARTAMYAVVFDRIIAFVMMPGGLMVELMSRDRVGRKSYDPLAGRQAGQQRDSWGE